MHGWIKIGVLTQSRTHLQGDHSNTVSTMSSYKYKNQLDITFSLMFFLNKS